MKVLIVFRWEGLCVLGWSRYIIYVSISLILVDLVILIGNEFNCLGYYNESVMFLSGYFRVGL